MTRTVKEALGYDNPGRLAVTGPFSQRTPAASSHPPWHLSFEPYMCRHARLQGHSVTLMKSEDGRQDGRKGKGEKGRRKRERERDEE